MTKPSTIGVSVISEDIFYIKATKQQTKPKHATRGGSINASANLNFMNHASISIASHGVLHIPTSSL